MPEVRENTSCCLKILYQFYLEFDYDILCFVGMTLWNPRWLKFFQGANFCHLFIML